MIILQSDVMISYTNKTIEWEGNEITWKMYDDTWMRPRAPSDILNHVSNDALGLIHVQSALKVNGKKKWSLETVYKWYPIIGLHPFEDHNKI